MTLVPPDWESRCSALWSRLEQIEPAAFIAQMDILAGELPENHAVGLFERASARDSTGHSNLAEPLYRAALNAGLQGLRRRRATIQLASSIRYLGRAVEAAHLLEGEAQQPSDELDDAVYAFLALSLADLGREREALKLVLHALNKHLPRYNKSLARYTERL